MPQLAACDQHRNSHAGYTDDRHRHSRMSLPRSRSRNWCANASMIAGISSRASAGRQARNPFSYARPFAKLTTNFVSTDAEKIEFLCDGQQVVAHGIHPDTLKPYSWFGGDPTIIAYDDLPYISAEEAQQLQSDVTELLVRDFGYVVAAGRAGAQGERYAAGSRRRLAGADRQHFCRQRPARQHARSRRQDGAQRHGRRRHRQFPARVDEQLGGSARSTLAGALRQPSAPGRHHPGEDRARAGGQRQLRRRGWDLLRRHRRHRHRQAQGQRRQQRRDRCRTRRSRTRSRYSGNGCCSTTTLRCLPCSAPSPPTNCRVMRSGSE